MPHFSAFAAETPDRPAYIMANSGEVVTYAELDRRSNQVAHLLRASGVNRGDHIAIMMKNCTEFLQVAQGALRAGIIFTPISTHLKQDETAYIITNCKAKLFVASASLAEVATEAAAAAGGLGRCLSVGGDIAGFERLDEELAKLPETPIEDEFLGAPMLYSSGTTGKPKGRLLGAPRREHPYRSSSIRQCWRFLWFWCRHRLFVARAAVSRGTFALQHHGARSRWYLPDHGAL